MAAASEMGQLFRHTFCPTSLLLPTPTVVCNPTSASTLLPVHAQAQEEALSPITEALEMCSGEPPALSLYSQWDQPRRSLVQPLQEPLSSRRPVTGPSPDLCQPQVSLPLINSNCSFSMSCAAVRTVQLRPYCCATPPPPPPPVPPKHPTPPPPLPCFPP